jgi:hypothetical protein
MGQATANAQRAALEIVREAQQVDEALLPLLLTPREIAPNVPIHGVSSIFALLHLERD